MKAFISFDGSAKTIADLPAANDVRWVIRQKANLIAAIDGGVISMEDAMRKYKLSANELQSWRAHLNKFGPAGLRSTKTQEYRDAT